MFSQPLKFIKKHPYKVALGLSALLIFILIIFWFNTGNSFSKNYFLKKTEYQKKIITQTNFTQNSLIVTDTFIQSFDKQNRLIAENEVIFYDYNTAGKLSKIIVCLDKDCDNIIVKEPISPEIIHYSLNQAFFQMQNQNKFSRVIHQNEVLEPYIYQKDSLINSELRKVKYYFCTDTDTTFNICYQHYDSLQRLKTIRFSDKSQNFFFEINCFYDASNQLIMKHRQIKSSINEVYSAYYHIYQYDSKKRLKHIQTYQMPDSSLHSQTEFQYIE